MTNYRFGPMRALLVVAVFTALVWSPALAYAAGPPATGAKVEQLLRQPLPEKPGTDVLIIRVEYPPGGSTPPHSHPAFVYAYVLEGSVISQLDNQKPKTYTAGQLWSETPGQHHMISRNASTTTPATLLVYMIIPHNAQLLSPVPASH